MTVAIDDSDNLPVPEPVKERILWKNGYAIISVALEMLSLEMTMYFLNIPYYSHVLSPLRFFFSFYSCIRFVEDITYLPAFESNLYLNTMDMFNGEIVAWRISGPIRIRSSVWIPWTCSLPSLALKFKASSSTATADSRMSYMHTGRSLPSLGIRMSLGSKGIML